MNMKKAGITFLIIFFIFSFSCILFAESSKVYIIPIQGTIEPGLAGFVERSIKQAEDNQAAYVIFEIDTLGGRVDAATKIKNLILDTEIPHTIAFINKRAISAGALISLSAKQIIMAPAGTIGAAKPVTIGFGGSKMQPTDEKIVSYLRKEFKAAAETNGHPTDIAEAFVDQDVVIEGLIEKEKLLTLTTEEALKYKLAFKKIDSLENVLASFNLENAEVVHIEQNWSEMLTRILTNPILTSMLMTIGLLGIFIEIKTPGFGLPGIIGITALLIFFFAQHLVGLANYTELLIFLLGICLLLIEIFVIPGFGFLGMAGLILTISGLFMGLIKRPLPEIPLGKEQYLDGLYMLGTSLALTIGIGYILFRFFLPKVEAFSSLILKTEEKQTEGFVAAATNEETLLGKEGISLSSLRPAGKAMFSDELLDVISESEFIEKDEKIKIIAVEGSRIVVEKISNDNN